MTESGGRFGLGASAALTFGSAVIWGLAHLVTGRRLTGLLLLAVEATLVGAGVVMLSGHRARLLGLAVRPGWLAGLAVGLVVLGLAWAAVIICSYRLVRPAAVTRLLTAALCLLVIVPAVHAARVAYLSGDLITGMFGRAHDPWSGKDRVNILLLGADAATGREGIRTDSVTLASIEVRTGRAVLLGLPRNLERVPMPDGPARRRFPYGFAGDPPLTPGILNEIFQYAEDHPEMVPHTPTGKRGPKLLKDTVSGILGLPVHYYAMVDMKGFADIIDAMGGVTVKVREPIVYGSRREGLIPAGTRRLSGEAALWYGRSRTDSSDYVRMARQKCLLNAVARQAGPATLLSGFDRLARAARQAVSTDIPQSLLPGLIELSQRVRDSEIKSLQFVPPLIDPATPDYALIRRKTAESLHGTAPRPAATPSPARSTPVSLDETC
ncbi:LCP family glycopolymer transferase [Streptosporangium soli]|nr:LCP family protein [Streptosporangium sp. KLBMP 9127]